MRGARGPPAGACSRSSGVAAATWAPIGLDTRCTEGYNRLHSETRRNREKDLSAVQAFTSARARVSQEDEYARRPQRTEAEAGEGPPPAECVKSSKMPGDERLPRCERLHTRGSIRGVLDEGRRHCGRGLRLYVLANDAGHPRVAVVVGKRVGKAVVRNLVRRRVREVYRQNKPAAAVDLVFIARQEARTMEYAELRDVVLSLIRDAAGGGEGRSV